MFHYLSYNNKTIVDIEPWITTIYTYDGNKEQQYKLNGSFVEENIVAIIDLHNSLPDDKKEEFRKDMTAIGKMHSWFFEEFLPKVNYVVSNENLDMAHKIIEDKLTAIADKYNLEYGVD